MRQLAFLMIAIGAVLSAAPAAAFSVQSLRIQAWNLQQCRGTDDVCDLYRQAATMAQSNPDIILTSEIIDSHIPTYIAELNRLTGATWHSHFIPICQQATCDGAPGQGQAIFSRFAPSSTTGIFFTGQDRSAAAMIFNDVNGRPLAVVATHLAANGWDNNRDPDNSDLRAAAMTEMKTWAAGLAPVRIIGGDFNFNPTQTYGGATELSQMTTAGYVESWQKALEAGAASSYPDNPPSMDTRTRRSRIDYIFYIGSGLDAKSSKIRDIRDLNNTNVQILVGNSDDRGVRPSDHNMVEAVISVAAGGDTTPPSAAITAPSAGATVSGTIAVSANASDNVGVAGVQFKLDNQNLVAEDTTTPYSVSWNTATATNGNHVLTAVARDAAGNTAPSASVTVTVGNTTASGLVGHWKFDEGSGTTAADSSGNGVAGALINSPVWTTGMVGGALSFNGTNRVSIPNQPPWNTPSSKYTVAFWVKVNEIRDYGGVVAVGNWGTGALEIMTTSRQWMFRLRTSGGPNGWSCDGTSSTLGYLTTLDNTFHHVAVVLDAAASRCDLYSDGALVATDQYVDGTTSFGTQGLNIGGFADANRLQSVVDDVRLYNAALTQGEVQALAGGGGP
jgi:endonuclease/exonuclease/phosphatase family metal-dependent hydrolase